MVPSADSKKKPALDKSDFTGQTVSTLRTHGTVWWLAEGLAGKLPAMFAHVMSLPVSCAIVLGLFISLVAQAATNPLPPPLLDQFGEQRGLDTEPTAEQLVIVVSAKRLRRLKPWERELREHYPELAILRVADVPVSGSADTEAVAAKLRKRLPEDVAVLMDMNGVWAEAFQLDINVPNLLLFNSQLELTVQHAGFFKRSEFNSLRQQFDAVLDVAASEQGHAE